MGNKTPAIPDFKISFTFTGEYRETVVRPICEELLNLGFSKNEIFFDEWHSALFTGINVDTVFREIYHDYSDCVVVLLSPNYKDKPWTCNLEWPTVLALINEGKYHKICLLDIGNVDISTIDGLDTSRDVSKHVDKMSATEMAQFVNEWYCLHILLRDNSAKTFIKRKQLEQIEAMAKNNSNIFIYTSELYWEQRSSEKQELMVKNINNGVNYRYIIPRFMEHSFRDMVYALWKNEHLKAEYKNSFAFEPVTASLLQSELEDSVVLPLVIYRIKDYENQDKTVVIALLPADLPPCETGEDGSEGLPGGFIIPPTEFEPENRIYLHQLEKMYHRGKCKLIFKTEYLQCNENYS